MPISGLHLGYHFVRDEPAPGPTSTPSRLRAQIRSLQDQGYEFLTCREVARRMHEKLPLPERYAALSFDDALRDHTATVLPILEELGVPATFFVISCVLRREIPPVTKLQIAAGLFGPQRLEELMRSRILADTDYARLLDPDFPLPSGVKQGERPEYRRLYWVVAHLLGPGKMRDVMREVFQRYVGGNEEGRLFDIWCLRPEDILKLQRAGMEIASHTATHPLIQNCGAEEFEEELRRSRDDLTSLLGSDVPTFAWTYGGAYRDDLKYTVSRYYRSAWNFLSRLTAMPEPPYHPFDIPRLHEQAFNP